jgi:polar amino acid transport system substrate-binding protein
MLVIAVGCEPEPETLWGEIENEGVIVVGTSADYPPFEYIDDEGNYAGFDIELMEAVADELGLEVEWQDISFDGLIGSLQTEKIDAAIAAMSATAERDEQVDFTQPYYIGKDAVLTTADAGFEVGAKEDLDGLRVAVQTGTIQDDWVTENLTDAEISRYERAEQAVMDLKSGRVDAVAMDFFAASNYLDDPEVVLALETNFADEHMSIAVPEGAEELQAQLDGAIDQLREEGLIDELVMEYLVEE